MTACPPAKVAPWWRAMLASAREQVGRVDLLCTMPGRTLLLGTRPLTEADVAGRLLPCHSLTLYRVHGHELAKR